MKLEIHQILRRARIRKEALEKDLDNFQIRVDPFTGISNTSVLAHIQMRLAAVDEIVTLLEECE